MFDVSVSEDDIKKALGKLSNNSALGPDGIPVPCLKNGGQFLLDALKDLTRTSIDECRLPDILKMAWVTPIWKGEHREDPKEYRPISLTIILQKYLRGL